MIYSHDQNVVVYRKFTAEGFWHESQDYEFTHSCSRRRQKGRRQKLLPFGRSAREGKKSKEVDFCLCAINGFFTVVLADSSVSART